MIKMKKYEFILVIFMCLLTSACQNTTQEYLQSRETQHICRSLIEGILKLNQRSNFQIWQKKQITALRTEYWYKPYTEQGLLIALPKSASLKFECQNTPQRYVVQKIEGKSNPIVLISLEENKI